MTLRLETVGLDILGFVGVFLISFTFCGFSLSLSLSQSLSAVSPSLFTSFFLAFVLLCFVALLALRAK